MTACRASEQHNIFGSKMPPRQTGRIEKIAGNIVPERALNGIFPARCRCRDTRLSPDSQSVSVSKLDGIRW